MHFLEWKCMNYDLVFTEVCFKGPINNIPTLDQIMAWRRPGVKPLSEPMVVSLPTHICVSRPQWVRNAITTISSDNWVISLHWLHLNIWSDIKIVQFRCAERMHVGDTFQNRYALLAFVSGIHLWPVDSPHKGPVIRKMFPFDDVIMIITGPLEWFKDAPCFAPHWRHNGRNGVSNH